MRRMQEIVTSEGSVKVPNWYCGVCGIFRPFTPPTRRSMILVTWTKKGETQAKTMCACHNENLQLKSVRFWLNPCGQWEGALGPPSLYGPQISTESRRWQRQFEILRERIERFKWHFLPTVQLYQRNLRKGLVVFCFHFPSSNCVQISARALRLKAF